MLLTITPKHTHFFINPKSNDNTSLKLFIDSFFIISKLNRLRHQISLFHFRKKEKRKEKKKKKRKLLTKQAHHHLAATIPLFKYTQKQ